ncbi:MAG: hypothetical protein CVV56_03625 [Tenericutes bacterium HGW-Tenericutes-1]|jgi:hypothetical protein|nr:MAG: hypothetical protein CVV56_03625 [Tenericutes bacterium HGW-Tenericutes-1]
MKDMIKRYVYDVTRRLPENQREEVGKELLANINDMLPENPSEEDIKKVLVELGEPRILATSYRQKPRYLISPEWMDDYFQTLKIVMIVFGVIALISGLIENILNPEAVNVIGIIFEVFFKTISEIVQSLFSAFAIVTLIFAGISAHQSKNEKCEWDPKNLPELPKENVKKISKVESIVGLTFSIIFGTLFIYFMWRNQVYIGWFENGDFEHVVIPFFNADVLKTFIPFYIISVVLTIVESGLKLKSGHWNVSIATIHTVEQILSIIVLFFFATTTNLVNPTFWAEAAAYTEITAEQFSEGFSKGIYGFAWFVAVMGSIDILSTWFKTLKPNRKEIK